MTSQEIADLISQYMGLTGQLPDLPKPVVFDEKNVQLVISEPVAPEQLDLPPNAPHFYHLMIRIRDPDRRIRLGWIPEFESKDAWNNTHVILANLRKLWDQRRLLTVHSHRLLSCSPKQKCVLLAQRQRRSP